MKRSELEVGGVYEVKQKSYAVGEIAQRVIVLSLEPAHETSRFRRDPELGHYHQPIAVSPHGSKSRVAVALEQLPYLASEHKRSWIPTSVTLGRLVPLGTAAADKAARDEARQRSQALAEKIEASRNARRARAVKLFDGILDTSAVTADRHGGVILNLTDTVLDQLESFVANSSTKE